MKEATSGAGWNFGIATAFEFRLQPFRPELHRGVLTFPATQIQDVWTVFRNYAPEAPDAVKPSGLDKADPVALRVARSVFGDLLGRPPTPPEALAAAGKSPADIGASLLNWLMLSTMEWLKDHGHDLPVLKAEPALRASRLALCELVARTLQTGLGLLGIEVLERM